MEEATVEPQESSRPSPKDVCMWSPGDKFEGTIYFIDNNGNRIFPDQDFDLTSKKLDPFRYLKPEVDTQGNLVKVVPEEKLREGYYPLLIAKNAKRAPNHLYETDDLLIAAVNFLKEDGDYEWQTRAFPRKGVPPETWTQAEEILENAKQSIPLP